MKKLRLNKKICLIYILLIFIKLVYLNAQMNVYYISGITRKNIVVKLNEETTIGRYYDNYYSKDWGFSTGLMTENSILKNHLFFRSGVTFSQKGAKYQGVIPVNGIEIYPETQSVNIYYIEIPMELHFEFFKNTRMEGGIYNAFGLNINNNKDNNSTFFYDRHDIGFIAGLGYYYKDIGIGFKYSKSIIPIGTSAGNNYEKKYHNKHLNETMLFSISYKIFTKANE